jgi:cation:H+ antiporter
MLIDFLLAFIAIILLFFGAEILVRFSSRLALNIGMKPFFVGMTIIAYATSMPEAVTSVISQMNKGNDSLTLGNVIGSNISNIALVLGVVLLFNPIKISKEIRRTDLWFFLASNVIFVLLLFPPYIGRFKAILFICFFIIIITIQIFIQKKKILEEKRDKLHLSALFIELLMILIGLVGVLYGAYLLITSGVNISEKFGISKRIIGLTFVAIGTSLPELAISIISALKKNVSLAVGNILGSNIFNTLAIIGLAGLINPINVSRHFLFVDIPVMIFFSLLIAFVCWWKKGLSRSFGSLLLVLYFSYLFIFVF